MASINQMEVMSHPVPAAHTLFPLRPVSCNPRETASISSSKLSAYKTKPCRYDMAGYCRAGDACPFRHSHTEGETEIPMERRESYGIISHPPPGLPPRRPSVGIPMAPYPVYPGYAYSPVWPGGPRGIPLPSGSPVSPQALLNAGSAPSSFVSSPCFQNPFDHGSIIQPSPTFSQSSLVDELVTPQDVRFSEPFIRRGSYPLLAPNSISSFYPPSQYMDRFGTPGSKDGRPNRSSSQGARKLSAYKTKSCRFWDQDGACPNGINCTFIHDGDVAPRVEPQSSDEGSILEGSPTYPRPVDLPPRPVSVVEEQKKHGFYPISWRVIGGGVMMSGRREPCRAYLVGQCEDGDECAYSHDDASDDSASQTSELEFDETFNSNTETSPSYPVEVNPVQRSSGGGPGKTKPSRPLSIAVPPAAKFLPASEAFVSAPNTAVPQAVLNHRTHHVSDSLDPGSASHRRTKSMSTAATTPSSPSLDPVNLFSAESPPGL